MIQSHHISIDSLVPILPQLNCDKHTEALSSLLVLLKNHKPTSDCVKYLFAREPSPNDLFVITVMKHWCQDYSEKLSELVSNFINSRCGPGTPNKRKRLNSKSSSSVPNANQVLGHLSQFRLAVSSTKSSSSSNLCNMDNVKKALKEVYQNCNENQRKTFNNLFSTVIHDDDDSSKKSSGRGRKAATSSTNTTTSTSAGSSTKSSSTSSSNRKVIAKDLTDSPTSSSEVFFRKIVLF